MNEKHNAESSGNVNPPGNGVDEIEYDSETGTYRASYEESMENPIVGIVEVIASLEETDPIALEPLGRTIDMDALNAVLHHSDSAQTVQVSFSYRKYRVTIQNDGVIEVLPTDSDQANSNTAG